MNGIREIQYALDENGRYVQVPSTGWEPKNVALLKAREVFAERAEAARRKARAGELSPLAYHLERNLMDVRLLARYSGLSRWTIRRLFDPGRFARAGNDVIRRLADALNLAPDELRRVP